MPKVVPEYKEEAKRRIIEAAIDVIAERGCDQLTFDQVAKKIGVTKGAVYWYFKTKEELITAVLKRFRTDFERTTFESFYNRPIDEMLLQIFDRFTLTDNRQRAIFFEMFALAVRSSDVRHATRDYYQGLVATFEDAIKREQKQQLLDPDADPHTLALLMVALYSGLQNFEMVWMCPDEIKNLWLDGIKHLLGPVPATQKKEQKKK
ncbi:MAG: TetR/AcrR family transcriptional regulator [Methanospirillum sp.]|uniref:TetR/AcrR family transcriptional regulator n=1 Tax=Methanospirillum sp. TaxID=45200 RepID=UPI00236B944C|nr:TetR/AcrR family transcriptional regulator [Methanospirillum sp.]MDD1728373.1 TetR/AcrR family transcriptional regulator [Methanospirillum sp.]